MSWRQQAMILMAGIAIALPGTAAPKPAATTPAAAPKAPAKAAAAPTGLSDAAAAEVGLDRFDRRFVEETAAEGQNEVALAQLATDRAQDARVRQYAQGLGQEHTNWTVEMGALAHTKNVAVENDLPGDRMYRSVAEASAAHFDDTFLDAVIHWQERDLKRFESATAAAKDNAVKAFAHAHIDALRQQLQAARQLKQAIKT